MVLTLFVQKDNSRAMVNVAPKVNALQAVNVVLPNWKPYAEKSVVFMVSAQRMGNAVLKQEEKPVGIRVVQLESSALKESVVHTIHSQFLLAMECAVSKIHLSVQMANVVQKEVTKNSVMEIAVRQDNVRQKVSVVPLVKRVAGIFVVQQGSALMEFVVQKIHLLRVEGFAVLKSFPFVQRINVVLKGVHQSSVPVNAV